MEMLISGLQFTKVHDILKCGHNFTFMFFKNLSYDNYYIQESAGAAAPPNVLRTSTKPAFYYNVNRKMQECNFLFKYSKQRVHFFH